jgi:hypothetical protein
VTAPSYSPGDRLPSGKVYRRIPNWKTHFDFETGKPDLASFQEHPQTPNCISADLNSEEIVGSLNDRRHTGFGMCVLDIERMAAETGDRAWVEFTPRDPPGSPTHVSIHGCGDAEVQAILADLAEMVPGYYPKPRLT